MPTSDGRELMIKHMTHAKASELLVRIQAYWADKGYQVTGHVVEAGYSERLRSTVYEIKTDLLNGRPIKRAAYRNQVYG